MMDIWPIIGVLAFVIGGLLFIPLDKELERRRNRE